MDNRAVTHRCDVCGRCFSRRDHLKRHMDSVHISKALAVRQAEDIAIGRQSSVGVEVNEVVGGHGLATPPSPPSPSIKINNTSGGTVVGGGTSPLLTLVMVGVALYAVDKLMRGQFKIKDLIPLGGGLACGYLVYRSLKGTMDSPITAKSKGSTGLLSHLIKGIL